MRRYVRACMWWDTRKRGMLYLDELQALPIATDVEDRVRTCMMGGVTIDDLIDQFKDRLNAWMEDFVNARKP